jgi:hypothetical protein
MVLAHGLAFPLGRNAQETKGWEQENEKKKELVLETEIPRAVKLIAVRGIQRKDWFKHLEIEIENASEKQISYIEVFVAMPEIIVDGARAAFTLRYGDKAAEHARPSSSRQRLEPGKRLVFRITQGQIDAIENAIKVTGLGLSDVTRVGDSVLPKR